MRGPSVSVVTLIDVNPSAQVCAPGSAHLSSSAGERVFLLVLLAVAGAGTLTATSSSDFTTSETFSAILFIGERPVPPSRL